MKLMTGKTYRLLPGATFAGGAVSDLRLAGTTRVILNELPDEVGDVVVTAIDGNWDELHEAENRYVHESFLGALPDDQPPKAATEPTIDPLRIEALACAQAMFPRAEPRELVYLADWLLNVSR